LLGRAPKPNLPPPEVIFTLERASAPRLASKGNNYVDEPGAFAAREFLRNLLVGKTVQFETRKQGATAGDRVYGLLYISNPDVPGEVMNIAVESVKRGLATPKLYGAGTGGGDKGEGGENGGDGTSDDPAGEEYVRQLEVAFNTAKNEGVGIHRSSPPPLVRTVKNAVDDFLPTDLVYVALSKKQQIRVVLEYMFDGSRYRCHVTDDSPVFAAFQYCNFTLILAGVNCPRTANPRTDPPTPGEPYAQEARTFVEQRLLQRELMLSLHGTDKSGSCIVGTIHHPKGSIAVELLKRGYGKVTDWTARMMDALDLPALRVAENGAKVCTVQDQIGRLT
jgi:staphylococcal nuclease domain-containing protein 1